MTAPAPQASTHRRRTRKLIRDSFQLRLVASFVGLAAIGLALQFLLLGYRVFAEAAQLSGQGGALVDELPGMMLQVLAVSFGLVLPLILWISILATQRVAGPVYHFEKFLGGVLEGSETKPCKLRDGDQLKELCELLNRATEAQRTRNAAAAATRASDVARAA